jgi:hypothetical protein
MLEFASMTNGVRHVAVAVSLAAAAAAANVPQARAQETSSAVLHEMCAALDLQVLLRLDDSRLDGNWPTRIRVEASKHQLQAKVNCANGDREAAVAQFELALGLLGEPWLTQRLAMARPAR